MQPKPGDKVFIKTVKEELEGHLLESSDSLLYLLKLDNGYNIGVRKEDVVEIEVEKEVGGSLNSAHSNSRPRSNQGRLEIRETAHPPFGAEVNKKKTARENSKNLPKIDLIITGGTISSRLDPKTGANSWLTDPKELLKFYPELTEVAQIRKIKIPFMKASENMDYKDWQVIAKEVYESVNEDEVEGVIVTHGTDFLHYTASSLSFFLRNLNKPVVLTYSQRSSDRASSDARLNLICAAKMAISDVAEVMLVGHENSNDEFCVALRGTKTRKMHTSRRDAFKSINDKPLARISKKKVEILSSNYVLRDNKRKVRLDDVFSEKIAHLRFYPGFDPEILDYISENYRGLVLEPGALGHVAIEGARKNILPKLKKAIDHGLIVVASPQTLYGRLDPLVYTPGRILMKTGIIFLEDMLPETAYVKLGWVLGHKQWKEKIKDKMLENFSGEINKRLEE